MWKQKKEPTLLVGLGKVVVTLVYRRGYISKMATSFIAPKYGEIRRGYGVIGERDNIKIKLLFKGH